MKKKIALLLAMVLVVSSLAGCGKKAESGELVPLKIAFCTWAGYAPLFIAEEKGYFEEAGYDVTGVIKLKQKF